MHIYEFLAVLSVRKPLVTYNLSNVHDFKLKLIFSSSVILATFQFTVQSDMWLVAAILVETDAGGRQPSGSCAALEQQAAEGKIPHVQGSGRPQ